MNININQGTCRTCLTETVDSIFQVIIDDNIEIPLIVMLSECTGIEVSGDDEISLNICDGCVAQLINTHLFRKKCWESDKILRNELHSKIVNEKDDKTQNSSSNTEIINNVTINEIVKLTFETDTMIEIEQLNQISNTNPLETICNVKSDKTFLPHECSVCSRRFKRLYNMKRHMKTHVPFANRKCETNVSFFHVCEFCSHEFISQYHLQEHLLKHANDVIPNSNENGLRVNINKDLVHECPKCNKCFKRRYNLKTHMNTHEPPDKRIRVKRKVYFYICDYCGHTFNYKNHLRQHIRMHTGEKPYKCDMCEYSSSYYAGLKQHKQSHSNERKFQCKFCNNRFKTAAARAYHHQNHSENGPIECMICSKLFKNSNILRRHKRVIHSSV